MAFYTTHYSSNSSKSFRERIHEIRDRMYPNTVPAHRRKKNTTINSSVYNYIAEQQQEKGTAIRSRKH